MRHDAQERRTMSYVTESWEMAAQTVIKKFEKRGISACYCATKEEAKETILNMIPKGSKVANGGTESMVEAGIMEAVQGPDYHYIDRNAGKTPQEAREIYADRSVRLLSDEHQCLYQRRRAGQYRRSSQPCGLSGFRSVTCHRTGQYE